MNGLGLKPGFICAERIYTNIRSIVDCHRFNISPFIPISFTFNDLNKYSLFSSDSPVQNLHVYRPLPLSFAQVQPRVPEVKPYPYSYRYVLHMTRSVLQGSSLATAVS